MLRVTINRQARTAIFAGPGTFSAKDEIKSLGRASWVQAQKVWQVSSFTLSLEETKQLFPQALVVESDDFAQEQNPEPEFAANSLPPAVSVAQEVEVAALSSDRINVAAGLPSSSSVSELSQRIRALLQREFARTIFVHGVISSPPKTKGSWLFFDLADIEKRTQSLSCAVFRDVQTVFAKLFAAGFKLEAELPIMLEVRVGLVPTRGNISLEIVGVVPEFTIAKLVAQREQTNERLKKEGIFSRNKQQQLPLLPRRLGVLTSSGGTVINDFLASLSIANFGFEVYWLSVSVQGAEAKREVLSGLHQLGKMDLDAVLIFRGGGSAADLAVFNDYDLARAVCLYPLPVISAIGHQEDQSSLQDVSFLALGVPKDIGRFFADIVLSHRQALSEMLQTIAGRGVELQRLFTERVFYLAETVYRQAGSALQAKEIVLQQYCQLLPNLVKQLWLQSRESLLSRAGPISALAGQLVVHQREKLHRALEAVISALRNRCERAELSLQHFEALIASIAPEVQLRRGFVLVRDNTGKNLLTAASKLAPQTEVQLQFHDGAWSATLGEFAETKNEEER